jgi:hypothetical protein
LDGGNYYDWKFAASLALRRNECWDCISADSADAVKNYAKKAETALTIIGLTVEPSQYSIIRNCEDGREAWTALSEWYEKTSRANRIALKRQLYSYQGHNDQTAQEIINVLTDIFVKLHNIGVELKDDEKVDLLLMKAPKKFGAVVATLATREELKPKEVISALVDEESRLSGGAIITGNGKWAPANSNGNEENVMAARAKGPNSRGNRKC